MLFIEEVITHQVAKMAKAIIAAILLPQLERRVDKLLKLIIVFQRRKRWRKL
jgi:hypothetical protein